MTRFRNNDFRILLIGLTVFLVIQSKGFPTNSVNITGFGILFKTGIIEKNSLIDKINSEINYLNSINNVRGLSLLADSLKTIVSDYRPDSVLLSEYCYYIGVCNLFSQKYYDALPWLEKSVQIKRLLQEIDEHYINGLYNIGVTYNYIGEHMEAYNAMRLYLDLAIKKHGEFSKETAEAYLSLIGSSIEAKEFDRFLEYSFKALEIIDNNNLLGPEDKSALYNSIGTGYGRLADYSKAILYFEKAEAIIESSKIGHDDNYINMMNSLALVNGYLGNREKETYYFEKGISLALSNNSFLANNMINSYAISLAKSGQIEKGANLLSVTLLRAENVYGTESRYYIEVLKNYAEYLRYYSKDVENSVKYFSQCADFIENHSTDLTLRDAVTIGYSLALSEMGESQKSLEMIQQLIHIIAGTPVSDNFFWNPDATQIKADQRTLKIVQAKYNILKSLYSRQGNTEYLKAAAETSELIVSLIEKIRINISEEESRLILGNNYREIYIQTISDLNKCFVITHEEFFMDKAFEYAERSKVAGLLAATRELNAIQFHIPPVIAELEKSVQKEISYYNSLISRNNENPRQSDTLTDAWKENLIKAIKTRDSLVLTFEKEYPGYFSIKYNTNVPGTADIPGIIGRKTNYISYVLSDSVLYTFVINKSFRELITLPVDKNFFNSIRQFNELLSDYAQSDDARVKFEAFQERGNELYRYLIEPVNKYLISENLLISPDNILSYIPFETLIYAKYEGNNIYYRDLGYLMSIFNISYTYSATFLEETVKKKYRRLHSTVAFAPAYNHPINTDSLFSAAEKRSDILFDLPYARQEAEYVADITDGKAFLNNEASESVFKNIAGDYDILHMAMHTVLNDVEPMNSAMIFSDTDNKDDGFLFTFEIYGIPLMARMVVLSSCNTGNGVLATGEGILSLARGFMYSGSRSVVMSLWEIEDKSGTDIIRLFYRNLKRGYSKSEALRRARLTYLKTASQLKSHPYYWSTLVVYGDNKALYSFTGKACYVLVVLLILLLAVIYLRYRKYS